MILPFFTSAQPFEKIVMFFKILRCFSFGLTAIGFGLGVGLPSWTHASIMQDTNGKEGSILLASPVRCFTTDVRDKIDNLYTGYSRMQEALRSNSPDIWTEFQLDFAITSQFTTENVQPSGLDSTQYSLEEVRLLRKQLATLLPETYACLAKSKSHTSEIDALCADVWRIEHLHTVSAFLSLYFSDLKDSEKAFEHLVQAVDLSEAVNQVDGTNARFVQTKATERNLHLFIQLASRYIPPSTAVSRLEKFVNNSTTNQGELRRAIALDSHVHLHALVDEYRKQGKYIDDKTLDYLLAESADVQSKFQYEFWDRSSFSSGNGFSDRRDDVFDTSFENLEGQLMGGVIFNYYMLAENEQWRRTCVAILAMILEDFKRNTSKPIVEYLERFKVAKENVEVVIDDKKTKLLVNGSPQGPQQGGFVRIVNMPQKPGKTKSSKDVRDNP